MKFPEIIIIGSAKCGTTALWYNLDKHPEISMACKTKESVEFNFWRGPCWRKGIDWYKSKFEDGMICGEKSVLYLNKKGSMNDIHLNIPDVKLFACLRHPVDRAYSQWQMNNLNGKVGSFTFSLFKSRYSNIGHYYDNIKDNVLPYFDKKQLHICICEYMKKNPTVEMKKVFDFIGVSDLNLPKKVIYPILREKRTRQEDIILNRKEKFYRVWSRHKQKIRGSLRQDLLEYYKPHNERFFEFLGYEIGEWNK
jgi:hypothetical protein